MEYKHLHVHTSTCSFTITYLKKLKSMFLEFFSFTSQPLLVPTVFKEICKKTLILKFEDSPNCFILFCIFRALATCSIFFQITKHIKLLMHTNTLPAIRFFIGSSPNRTGRMSRNSTYYRFVWGICRYM